MANTDYNDGIRHFGAGLMTRRGSKRRPQHDYSNSFALFSSTKTMFDKPHILRTFILLIAHYRPRESLPKHEFPPRVALLQPLSVLTEAGHSRGHNILPI